MYNSGITHTRGILFLQTDSHVYLQTYTADPAIKPGDISVDSSNKEVVMAALKPEPFSYLNTAALISRR